MPKYRVLTQPSGLINGSPWPPAGGILEVSALMSGPHIELIEADEIEERPAAGAVEKRPARTRRASK
jgi:hypothetical protein